MDPFEKYDQAAKLILQGVASNIDSVRAQLEEWVNDPEMFGSKDSSFRDAVWYLCEAISLMVEYLKHSIP